MPTFDVIVNSSFTSLCVDPALAPVAHKHVLGLANDFEDGAWRHKKFEQFIWDNVIEAALSAKEKAALIDNVFSALVSAAKNLRLTDREPDHTKGSELAEILLYGIMREHFNAQPVVPKIFYKQNVNDYAKGADSVHIVIESKASFSIWFGEAKFYTSIENARLGPIIASVGELLKTDKLKKENSIVLGISDLDTLDIEEPLRISIKAALDNKESIDNLKPILNIPILLLHECALTKLATEMSAQYRLDVENYHRDRANAYFKKQIESLGGTVSRYSEIKFHLILVPVPEKKPIVDKFLSRAEGLRS